MCCRRVGKFFFNRWESLPDDKRENSVKTAFSMFIIFNNLPIDQRHWTAWTTTSLIGDWSISMLLLLWSSCCSSSRRHRRQWIVLVIAIKERGGSIGAHKGRQGAVEEHQLSGGTRRKWGSGCHSRGRRTKVGQLGSWETVTVDALLQKKLKNERQD